MMMKKFLILSLCMIIFFMLLLSACVKNIPITGGEILSQKTEIQETINTQTINVTDIMIKSSDKTLNESKSIGEVTDNRTFVTDIQNSEGNSKTKNAPKETVKPSMNNTTKKTEVKEITPKPTTNKPTETPGEPIPDGINPKNPKNLSEETVQKIREDYLKSNPGLLKNEDFKLEDIKISAYFGTYNSCIVMRITTRYHLYLTVMGTEEVAGYNFQYSSSARITVWRNGDFYRLDSLYEQGILTQHDIKDINYYFYNDPKN